MMISFQDHWASKVVFIPSLRGGREEAVHLSVGVHGFASTRNDACRNLPAILLCQSADQNGEITPARPARRGHRCARSEIRPTLIDAMQASPYREIELEVERAPMYVGERNVTALIVGPARIDGPDLFARQNI